VLQVLAVPLGRFIARVMEGRLRWARAVEAPLYRLCGVKPETGMTWLSYTLALLGAATGIVAVVALIRGFARHSAQGLGNVGVDLTRVALWVRLPLSLVFALFLVQQGVVQNFAPYQDVTTVEANT